VNCEDGFEHLEWRVGHSCGRFRRCGGSLKTFKHELNGGLRFVRGGGCGLGGTDRGKSLVGQHCAIAGGLGISPGHSCGGLCSSAAESGVVPFYPPGVGRQRRFVAPMSSDPVSGDPAVDLLLPIRR
jgi:hypothetical protein